MATSFDREVHVHRDARDGFFKMLLVFIASLSVPVAIHEHWIELGSIENTVSWAVPSVVGVTTLGSFLYFSITGNRLDRALEKDRKENPGFRLGSLL